MMFPFVFCLKEQMSEIASKATFLFLIQEDRQCGARAAVTAEAALFTRCFHDVSFRLLSQGTNE
jgi:hypothetical protein